MGKNMKCQLTTNPQIKSISSAKKKQVKKKKKRKKGRKGKKDLILPVINPETRRQGSIWILSSGKQVGETSGVWHT